MKTNAGRFFEDYSVGQEIVHAVPRTLSGGERAMYHALYPARHALASSDEFARNVGFERAPLDDLIAFHTVFGKTVPDVSLNAVANLGYAEGRFLRPVFTGDTLTAISEVIGLKQNSSGKTGVVYVRTRGENQRGEVVLSYVRWVMVRKGDLAAPAPETVVPKLADHVAATDLPIPSDLDFASYNYAQSGAPYRVRDYNVGEIIDHVDGVTIEEAEHMLATRLWQNTAKVHFDAMARDDGRRLIYGGHVISMVRALSFNGLANLQRIVAINAGAHVNPCYAGDTIRAWSEVLDVVKDVGNGVGAMRMRLVATKGAAGALRGPDGKYLPEVLLDLDYWGLAPA
jgi:2-methylfumaryl-CoA hydratase